MNWEKALFIKDTDHEEVIMVIIYKPQGRAKEFADLAINIYKGCTHSCKYCYGAKIPWVPAEKYYETANPKGDVISRLKKDAKKLKGNSAEILLSFKILWRQIGWHGYKYSFILFTWVGAMPVAAASSSTEASLIFCTEPNCLSRTRFRLGPIPGIPSRAEVKACLR